ncbi:MAG: hypothetical protein QW568_00225 [Candidatus Anstonellaceae archaeon]
MRFFLAQGATEYLVLLAVVLIIALASIALLGWFPGTSSDVSLSESQIYWKSASPIAIVETGEGYRLHHAVVGGDQSYPNAGFWDELYNASGANLRLRNTGSYPLTITKVLGGGRSVSIDVTDVQVWVSGSDVSQWHNISITIQPGEDSCLGTTVGTVQGSWDKIPCREHEINFLPVTATRNYWGSLPGASTWCDLNGRGLITIKDFGFEYNQTIGGQQIKKRQIGAKPLIINCIGWCNGTGFGANEPQLCYFA